MKIEQYLDGLASLHGRPLNHISARIFLNALGGYPESLVIAALDRCTRELRTFPTIADVISRIEDGHPGVEEAWAMIPKSEDETACWTDEIREAYAVCASLLAEDSVAARMTFKEVYVQKLQQARANRISPRWSVSLGHDKDKRVTALLDAVNKKRLTKQEAQVLLPDTSFADPAVNKQISGPASVGSLVSRLVPSEKVGR